MKYKNKKIIILIFIISIILNGCLAIFIESSSTPGIISQDQISEIPLGVVYGIKSNQGSLNHLQQIGFGCKNLENQIQLDYYPILILNSTAYLARFYGFESLNLAVVTKNEVNQLVIQKNLAKIGNNGISEISYDDSLGMSGSFLFIDSNGSINIYDIYQDNAIKIQFLSPLNFYPNQYYDYNRKMYYAPTYDTSGGSLVQSILMVDISQTSNNFFSISSLNLPNSLDSISVSSYNGQLVLFGPNSNNEKSYLYLVNTKLNTFNLLGEKEYNTTMITGYNSRYLLFVNDQGTESELYDLSTLNSKIFNNNCFNTYYPDILTSIIPNFFD